MLPDVFPTAIEHGPDLFRKLFAAADQNDHVLRIAMIRSSCAKKPHRNQLQDRLFSGREGRQIRRTHGSGRNNGMVIADLSTVTHSIHGKFCAVVGLPVGSIGSDLFGYLSDQGREHRLHVLCQVSAVGTRIGHKLLFIERLGVIQRLLCGESEDTVRITLQAGQIIEKWGMLRFLFSIHGFNHGFHALLAFCKHLLRILLGLKTPAGGRDAVHTKLHGVKRLRYKGCDLCIPHNDHGQRRRHHAAHIQCLMIQA